jgi:hypothetical protein
MPRPPDCAAKNRELKARQANNLMNLGQSADDADKLPSCGDNVAGKSGHANGIAEFKLPFIILEAAIADLAKTLSTEDCFSEREASKMEEFASRLQQVADDCRPSDDKAVDVVSEVVPDISSAELYEWQEELVTMFKKLDADKSGSLSSDELRKALTAAGMPKARLMKLLRQADADNSGEIELNEWIRVITMSSNEELRNVSRKLQEKIGSGALVFEEKKHFRFMINPVSVKRMTWDAFILGICTYIAICFPFVIAWEDSISKHTNDIFGVVDVCTDAIFVFDIFINFFTGFYGPDGELIMSCRRTAGHYLRTWFWLDFVSTFPFDDLSGGNMVDLQVLKLLKLGKLLKIVKLLAPRNVDISDFSELLEDVSTTKIVQIIHRRCAVLFNMVVLCHWLACGMKIVDQGFLTDYMGGALRDRLWSEYLAAWYFAMTTLTSVGYGDITPKTDGERVYTTFAMVIGCWFYGYVVGCICSMISNNDLNATAYYDRMELVHAWLTHHRLPLPMKRMLRRYFKAYLQEKSALKETDIWHDLSPELQKEVGEYMISEDVKMNPIFDGLKMGTIVRLQSILHRITVLQSHAIIMQGEAGTAMYIIVSGLLELTREKEQSTMATKLGAGESFGEEILLGFSETYDYTVVVLEKAKLEMIVEDDFLHLFQFMPNVLERMRQNAVDLNPQWARD